MIDIALRNSAVATALTVLFTASPAAAEIPERARAMIEAAIETGDPKKVDTVIELAQATNPDDAEEIAAIGNAFYAERQQLATEKAAAREEDIRTAGLIENWEGEGQIGAFRSTGNTSNTGFSAGLEVERIGIDWRHKVTGLIDYQRNNGVTTREQFRAAYEPNYRLSDRVFLYALGRYKRSRFQGYRQRYSISNGAGYRLIDNDHMQLSFQGGPAWRATDFQDGTTDRHIAGLASTELDWKISDRVKFSQDANAIVQPANSSFVSISSLEAGLGGSLSARLTYKLEHDTDPPIGVFSTDTLSRLTLVYGF